MRAILDKHLPLESNSSSSTKLAAQRQKDHYSHFILRLAFSQTEDLRRRFSRVESMLFRMRFNSDDISERAEFVSNLDLDWWEPITEDEKVEYSDMLSSMAGKKTDSDHENWYKVDWDRVPDLVEHRRVFIRAGKAFVPAKEQTSMVVAEFTSRLEKQLEVSHPKYLWAHVRKCY